MNIERIILSVALSLVACCAQAEWTGQGEAGFVSASGNTDSQTLNLALKFKNQQDEWRHDFGVTAYSASNDNVDSAKSFSAIYELKYELSERSFLFGALSYLDDEFDGFTEQASVSMGYGYQVIDTTPVAWDLSAGLGYRDTHELTRLDDGTELEGKDLSGATVVLKSDHRIQLTPSTELIDKFVAEIGADNSFIENEAALLVSINEKFSLKASVLIRHNTDPSPGSDDTDTITSANLVYKF